MNRISFGIVALTLGLAGCVGTDLVEELPTDEARIDVTPSVAAVQQGNTLRFDATYYDGFGTPVPNTVMRWESSAPDIASVDADGLVTGLELGQAMITAHTDDVSSPPVLLTVVADPASVARVVVTPNTLRLPIGTSESFTAEAFNLDGDRLEGKAVTWASSNPEVATIDAAGTALALQAGITDITATVEGVTSSAAILTVPGRSRQGTFMARAGTAYDVSGTVTLEELPSGGLRLTLGSDFNTSSGPGLEIFLSNSTTVGSSSFNVEPLRATSGEQDYFIDAGAQVTLDSFNNVVIHCVPFNVTFGHATLR